MFLTFEQAEQLCPRLDDNPQATRQEQLAMLVSFLTVAEASLANNMGHTLPAVNVTYEKVTRAKPRIEGQDYLGTPGVSNRTHIGRAVKVGRNQQDGHPYLTLGDASRMPSEQPADAVRMGFTCVRLEGLLSFGFADPFVMATFLQAARQAAQARSA